MDERLERNKQFVAEFYDVIINQKDFEKAKKFILDRSDKPKIVAPWRFVSDTTEYKIHDILVREVK